MALLPKIYPDAANKIREVDLTNQVGSLNGVREFDATSYVDDALGSFTTGIQSSTDTVAQARSNYVMRDPSDQTTDVVYPANLGSDQSPHYVQFTIYDIKSQGNVSSQGDAYVYSVNGDIIRDKTTQGQFAPGANASELVTGGFDKATGVISQISGADVGTSTLSSVPKYAKINKLIGLPVPDNVVTDHSTRWSVAEGGLVQGIVSYFNEDGQSIPKMAAMGVTAGITSLLESVGFEGGATQFAKSTKRAANPRNEFLFDGVNNRSFSFEWSFYPKSASEHAALFNLLEKIKVYMYPELDQALNGAFYIFPALFEIEFKSSAAENPYLFKTSSCALTNMVINYTGAGQWVAHDDGAPVAYSVVMQFTEVEFLHRGRFNEGIVR